MTFNVSGSTIIRRKHSWASVQTNCNAFMVTFPMKLQAGFSRAKDIPTRDSVHQHSLTLIPAWISNYMHYKGWDEINSPLPNFNGATVEVWGWISNFISYYIGHVITHPYHDDVIKWKHFPRNWPFVRGIHRSRWIPHTKASDAELWCLLWSASE